MSNPTDKAECEHKWGLWKEIGRTCDWFHPIIAQRKCEKCGATETEDQ